MSYGYGWKNTVGSTVAVGIAMLLLSSTPAQAHVALDEPNGGEVLEVGTMFTIEWHVVIQHDTINWDLWYSITGADGPWIPIAMDLPPGDITGGAMHAYDWTVPDDPSDEVRVRVRQDNGSVDYEDISDANLTIGTGTPDCIDMDEDGYGSPGR